MEIGTEEQHEEQDTSTKDEKESTKKEEKKRLVQLPLARVKHIMKVDSEGQIFSQDSVFLITKATELFLEYMGKESYKSTLAEKRKTLLKCDVQRAIWEVPRLCFLDGALEF